MISMLIWIAVLVIMVNLVIWGVTLFIPLDDWMITTLAVITALLVTQLIIDPLR